jgi:hypothetical protein
VNSVKINTGNISFLSKGAHASWAADRGLLAGGGPGVGGGRGVREVQKKSRVVQDHEMR